MQQLELTDSLSTGGYVTFYRQSNYDFFFLANLVLICFLGVGQPAVTMSYTFSPCFTGIP